MEKQNYFQPEIECASREQITKWQTEGLIRTVKHAYENSAYYRKKMDDHGVKPEDIKSLADITKLPFICKDDLREAYPYGLLCMPLRDCVRIQSTSGDVVQVCYGYGLFTGGPGLNGGSHKLGSLTLPMSSGSTDRQIQFMQDLGSTILCCTPSYAAYIGETIVERGLQDTIKLKAGIFGAEAWSEEMRRDIEKNLRIKAYDIYGLTELEGPGVSYECCEQRGMHICEDQFIAEIIDPNTGEVLPDGEKGELVFTSLNKQAFPMVRYRTRDICVLSHEKCSCGRTHVRMSKPMGRSDDMLIIKGVNVFPSQVETVLIEHGYSPNYQLVVDRVNNSDTLDINVEMNPDMFSDNLGEITAREKELVNALKGFLGIYTRVHLVAPKSIPRSEGKAVRLIDKRKI